MTSKSDTNPTKLTLPPFFPSHTITRPLPNGVTYDLSHPHETRITLPPHSTWSSGLHWHETHTEYLRIVKGSVRITLGTTTTVIRAAGQGEEAVEVEIPKWTRHEWRRVDAGGGDVIVIERTDPDDGAKAVFFWNLNGVVLHGGVDNRSVPRFLREYMVLLDLFVIFRVLDNWPVFLDLCVLLEGGKFHVLLGVARSMEILVTHVVLGIVNAVGKMVGSVAVREKFTPPELLVRWEKEKED